MTDTRFVEADNYAGVFDQRLGFGVAPAVITIDVMLGYTQEQYPFYCDTAPAALKAMQALLKVARETKTPIIHIGSTATPGTHDGAMMMRKAPSLTGFYEGAPMAQFDEAINVQKNETVLVKRGAASAFFGTNLAPVLTSLRCDTVILTGFSTSGCIRASTVDAIQHGFRPIVPREAVADRHPAPHAANLFDINAKYGDVIALSEAIDYLKNLNP